MITGLTEVEVYQKTCTFQKPLGETTESTVGQVRF